jgi:hypothetical protein
LDFDPNVDNALADIPSGNYSATFKTLMTKKPQWGRTSANWTWPLSQKEQLNDVCILTFEIPNNIHPPILFYYRLTNFYQNHRRYVKSIDTDQLKGKFRSADQIRDSECDPLEIDPSTNKPYYPCGLIANSMFNDTFMDLNASNPQDGKSISVYKLTEDGISWGSEGDLYGKTEYKPSDVVPPPNWIDQYNNGSYEGLKELPDLHTWAAFQVWMRTAGLPTFSKLAKRNDKDILERGTYRLQIYDSM